MANQILHRRDTAANWTTANPVLGAGEIGVESDTNTFKMGDGVTAWASLDYFSGGGGSEINAVATYTVGGSGDFATVAALSEYFLAQRHATAWEVSANNRQRAGFITIDLQGLNHSLGGAYISFEWFGSWLVFTNGAIGNGTLVFTNSNVRFANGFAAGYAGNTLNLKANGAFLFDSNDDTNLFSNLSSVDMARGSTLQIWNAYVNPVVVTNYISATDGSVVSIQGGVLNCAELAAFDHSYVRVSCSTSPELSSTNWAVQAHRNSSIHIENQPVSAAAGKMYVDTGSTVIFDATTGTNVFGSAVANNLVWAGSSVLSRTDLTLAAGLSVTAGSTVRVVGTATVSGTKTIEDSSALIDSTDSVELHPGLPTADPSISNALWSSGGVLMLSGGTPPSSYADADVDTHLNTSTATTGEVLSWTGTDYDWVAASGGASLAIDETGRVETQDYIQFTNSGGNDRMFLKVSDSVTANTWRGASGLGGYQFDVGTVNQAVVIEDGYDGVKLVGYHQETGGNEGLEIHGVGTTGATSTIRLMTNNTTGVRVTGSGKVYLENLPTADPVSAGQLWNDSGTLKVSAG